MSAQLALGQRVERMGDRVLRLLDVSGQFVLLVTGTARAGARRRFPLRETARQFEEIAVRSVAIVAITAVFTGMVLALQSAFALTRFGAKPYVGSLVGLSIVRELGPVLTALMVGGRVGAGIAAELGSMQVTEQVDAIRAMGADPLQKLVLPRVVAATLALPLLTVLANGLGILGGLAIADLQFSVSPHLYMQTVSAAVSTQDVLSGISKTFFFGWTIAMVGCFTGLSTTGGTEGVGRSTTRAVVVTSISIFVLDFFLTKILLAL